MNQNKTVLINLEDFNDFIISQVRYSLGRMTMMPWSTSMAIKRYFKYMKKGVIEVIKRDIRNAIDQHDNGELPIGWECDYTTWKELLIWIEKNEPSES